MRGTIGFAGSAAVDWSERTLEDLLLQLILLYDYYNAYRYVRDVMVSNTPQGDHDVQEGTWKGRPIQGTRTGFGQGTAAGNNTLYLDFI